MHKILKKYENPGMHQQLDIVWEKAKGCYVFTKKKKILDFTSTIFVSNIGHGNTNLIKSIKSVLNLPLIHTYNYQNKFRIADIKKLIIFSENKFDKAYLLSGGSETTEAALKLMRIYGISKKKKPGIISLKGNWHGRTMGAEHMAGNDTGKKWIGYNDKFVYHLDFPYQKVLKSKKVTGKSFFLNSLLKLKKLDFKKDISGFILEAFQGWGAITYPVDYVKQVQNFCRKNDILLTIDEMQSGFGRTGKKFCYQNYNISPDIICCGKGMGSGFPLSGLLGKKKVFKNIIPGSMSSTHSANPMACAAGIATINEIQRLNLVDKSKNNGQFLRQELNKLKINFENLIEEINCIGVIAAIIFKNSKEINGTKIANFVSKECLKNGLLVVMTGRESIKLGPPLIVSKSQIKTAVKIIFKSIKTAEKKCKF
jgi:4-aminobutyrate aminotransferase-like enzyme